MSSFKIWMVLLLLSLLWLLVGILLGIIFTVRYFQDEKVPAGKFHLTSSTKCCIINVRKEDVVCSTS